MPEEAESMTVAHGPIVVRKRLGWALKQLRMKRRHQLAEIAKKLEISPSKLSRIETGQVMPKYRDVRDLLGIYEAPPELSEQILEWTNEAKEPGWWQDYTPTNPLADVGMLVSLEAESRAKYTYSVPIAGLLQTEDYARMALRSAAPSQGSEDRERAITLRLKRQHVISENRPDVAPLELDVVLDEAALHRGQDRDVLRAQLRELVCRADQPNISIRVLPFSRGWMPATSTFAIYEPRNTDTDWPVVNVERTSGDSYIDAPDEVAMFREIWQVIEEQALNSAESKALITDLAER